MEQIKLFKILVLGWGCEILAPQNGPDINFRWILEHYSCQPHCSTKVLMQENKSYVDTLCKKQNKTLVHWWVQKLGLPENLKKAKMGQLCHAVSPSPIKIFLWNKVEMKDTGIDNITNEKFLWYFFCCGNNKYFYRGGGVQPLIVSVIWYTHIQMLINKFKLVSHTFPQTYINTHKKQSTAFNFFFFFFLGGGSRCPQFPLFDIHVHTHINVVL